MAIKFEAFEREIKIATAGLAPAAISAALAQFARQELADAIQRGEATPNYEIYVNARKGAAESTVIPPGPILYEFIWWRPIIGFALEFLAGRSPVDSGLYKSSWFVMVNNVVVTDFGSIPVTDTVIITNSQPYHRKIDVGHMRMSVEPGVVEAGRKAIVQRFGGGKGLVDAKRISVQIPGGYVLKGHFRRGFRPNARRGLQKDTKAGAAMTYPAIQLTMKT